MNNKISSSIILTDLRNAVSKDISYLEKLKLQHEIATDKINELLGLKKEIFSMIPEISQSMQEVPTTSESFKTYGNDKDLLSVENHNLHVISQNVERNGYPEDIGDILKAILEKYSNLVYQLKNKKMKGNFSAVES